MPLKYQDSPLFQGRSPSVAGRVLVLRQIVKSLIEEPISTEKCASVYNPLTKQRCGSSFSSGGVPRAATL
jgi:hypothetical protein